MPPSSPANYSVSQWNRITLKLPASTLTSCHPISERIYERHYIIYVRMYLWEMKKNIFFVFKSAYIIIIRNRDGGEGQEMDYNSTTSNYRQEHYVEAV